jgi:hypothetical protein
MFSISIYNLFFGLELGFRKVIFEQIFDYFSTFYIATSEIYSWKFGVLFYICIENTKNSITFNQIVNKAYFFPFYLLKDTNIFYSKISEHWM